MRTALEPVYEDYYQEIICHDFRGKSQNGMVFISLEELTYYIVNTLMMHRQFLLSNSSTEA